MRALEVKTEDLGWSPMRLLVRGPGVFEMRPQHAGDGSIITNTLRFDEIGAGMELLSHVAIGLIGRGGQHDGRHVAEAFIALDASRAVPCH